MPIPNDEIGGFPMHVKDCHIWSEIYYLDSPTDYREYLPPHGINPCEVYREGFVLLEPAEKNSGHFFLRILLVLVACLVICSLLWHSLQ